MAYLESAVVVYLREIYYPNGFSFPLKEISPFIYLTELGREIATIFMLFSVSYFMSNNKRELFAFFSYNFGIWDIWYYIWLKILLDWPDTLFTWDVLFLIPIPWIAPVLAPILIAISLITAALFILHLEDKNKYLIFSKLAWWMEGLAGLIIIGSFLFQTFVIIENEIPVNFPWWIFGIGLIYGLVLFFYNVKKSIKN
jgi:hypothetical protein